MRNLVEGNCGQCGHRYYQDLPSGNGLYYPAIIDAETYEVFSKVGGTYFSDYLLKSIKDKDTSPVGLTITRLSDKKKVVLLNCLNTCYGDCLWKLFNSQYYIDNFPDIGCCVLIPTQLRHLVPAGVSEIWEVDLPIKNLWRWYVSLEEQIVSEIRRKEKCFLSVAYSHPHPTLFSIDRFVRKAHSDLSGLGSPVLVFSYREDRMWGRSVNRQADNIRRLYTLLKKQYSNLSFILIGFGTGGDFPPEIIDKRTSGSDITLEQYWFDLLRVTDCVIGVHGSNMMIPTALSKFAVGLMPYRKLGNIFQDYIFNPEIKDMTEILYRFRTLYGNSTLSDISPQTLANVVTAHLENGEFLRDIMSLSWQKRDSKNPIVDTQPITEHFADYRHTHKGVTMWKQAVKKVPGVAPLWRILRRYL